MFAWVSQLSVLGGMLSMVAEAQTLAGTTNESAMSLERPARTVWEAGVGEGFRSSAESFGVGLGAGYGPAVFGGRESHDLALLGMTYGHMLSGTKGQDHWYRGNWEFRAEVFTGAQFLPETDWLVGFAPHVRYDFATGTRWMPFVDCGAGVAGTSIGPPDLSGTFEFNLQAAIGVHWFIRDDLAMSLEARLLHLSCGGINKPNLGLNTVLGMISVTWFF